MYRNGAGSEAEAATTIVNYSEEPAALEVLRQSMYVASYRLKQHPSVLVIGLGGGNDAWAAKAMGARSIKAIELNWPIVDIHRNVMRRFSRDLVDDPNVLALAAKVRYVIDPSSPYPRQFTGHVRVTLRDGEVREASQDHLRGGREEPLSEETLLTKFFANCLYGGWDRNRAARGLAALRGLRAADTANLHPLRG